MLLLAAAPSRAHGPAPAALGAHGNPAPFNLIRTNIGLAIAQPDGVMNYVCPAMWNSDERFPPVAQFPDGRVAVVHRGDAFIVSADGCDRQVVALPDAGTEADVLTWNAIVVAATRETEGSTLWQIDTQPQVRHRFANRVDSMQVDRAGALVLAAARPQASVYRITDEIVEEEELPFEAAFLAVRGDGQFLRASTDQGIVLLERADERWLEVLRADRSVHGPVRFADGWLVLADGRLHRRAGDDGGFTADVEVNWTCLQQVGEHLIACQDFGLTTVDAELRTTSAFDLSAFEGVQCESDAAHARCDGQWLHFAAEAGLLPDPEPAAVPSAAATNDGCYGLPGTPSGPGPWLALALIGWIATLRPTA